MRYINKYKFVFYLATAFVLYSCGAGPDNQGLEYAPNMYHSVPYEPLTQITDQSSGNWVSSLDNGVGEYYNSNPNNPHGMTMRVPPANTVRRNKNGYLPYRIPKDSIELAARILKNPLDSTLNVINEGKALYGMFCSHCHGQKGTTPGPAGEIYGGVTSYTSAAVKDKPEGHIFHVISQGKGRMASHASQISVEERWKIVRYVQVLQKQ
ncbi:MAG: cytochrome c [Cyclobacteriaceae bacterium]|nr:cytochrome c [Cyclobacteriaceae bacterium]